MGPAKNVHVPDSDDTQFRFDTDMKRRREE